MIGKLARGNIRHEISGIGGGGAAGALDSAAGVGLAVVLGGEEPIYEYRSVADE